MKRVSCLCLELLEGRCVPSTQLRRNTASRVVGHKTVSHPPFGLGNVVVNSSRSVLTTLVYLHRERSPWPAS
jgi:hypothetical protein